MPSYPLSLLVLLPDAVLSLSTAKISTHSRTGSHPTNDAITSLTTTNLSPEKKWFEPHEEDVDHVVVQNRRLSLAPGMGAGTQKPKNGSASSTSTGFTPLSILSGAAGRSPSPNRVLPSPPVFGEKRVPTGSSSRSGRRRPQTATGGGGGLKPSGVSRGSIAMATGTNLIAVMSGKNRPGWEGDEIVNVLRHSGLEVTVIRHVSHLPSILAPKTDSSAYSTIPTQLSSSRPTPSSTQIQQVILVPLGDSPTLPSLSLLLAQGTTPTAVCFQQDLLDRARRVEEEWLPTAVSAIRHVVGMRDNSTQSLGSSSQPQPVPVVLAYSANPALSTTVIGACVGAGAVGVLKPPFDAETARALRRMISAANEGRISSLVSLSSPPLPSSPSPGSPFDDEAKVVLTPTALSMGAEHEGEKVLSASIYSHRRAMSGHLSLSRGVSPSEKLDLLDDHHAESSLKSGTSISSNMGSVMTPLTANSTLSAFTAHQIYDPLVTVHSSFDSSRRRSVDTGGIALAFDRASKRFIPFEALDSEASPARRGSINVVAGDEEQDAADGKTTQLAEILGEMYQQTMSSIDIQMSEYDSLAEPIPREDRVRLVQALATWDFRPHLLTPRDLFRLACMIFEAILHTDGLVELAIEQDQVNRLLFAIRAIYHAPNPYHNYIHAIDVLQATYSFLVAIGVAPPFSYFLEIQPGKSVWCRPDESTLPVRGAGTRRARETLRPQDVFGVLIAAMGHDVGHPGLSNAFMKNAKVPLSVVYDDKSVLENMHCMLIVQLLRKHGFGFLIGTSTSIETASTEADVVPARAAVDSRSFRRVLYSAVLATDMSLHFAWIQRLKEFGEAMGGIEIVRPDEVAEEDRIMVCQALIKCADISNPTRPIDVSEHWSTVLLDEWTKQASLEQELSLPVSVVAGVDARLQAKGQVGFIDLFTQPLFHTTAVVLPELQIYAESCASNRGIWQSRLEQLEADTEVNEELTKALRTVVRPATPSAQDVRFNTLFPLTLPATLVSAPASPAANTPAPPHTPPTPRTPERLRAVNSSIYTSSASPAARAVRVVYHDEVHDRSMLSRHVLALTGFDPSLGGARRMSTPEALLVQGRS